MFLTLSEAFYGEQSDNSKISHAAEDSPLEMNAFRWAIGG